MKGSSYGDALIRNKKESQVLAACPLYCRVNELDFDETKRNVSKKKQKMNSVMDYNVAKHSSL